MTASRPSTLSAMLASLGQYWSAARPAQRLAYVVGAVLIAVGLAHGLLWLAMGGTADGPLSWRKPTTFGISFGLTTIALAWVAQFLALSDRALRVTLGVVMASSAVEVVWVSVQHARGVSSHFNDTTPLDNGLFLAAGGAILLTAGVVALYAVWSFTSCTAPPAMTLAVRASLPILLVSMGAGVWMILRGTVFDLTPATVSPDGSVKLFHAVGMHAIEVLPALAWVMSFGALAESRRRDVVTLAAVGYAMLLGLTGFLAVSGTGVAAPNPLEATVGAAGVVCLVAAGGMAVSSLRTRRRTSR